MVRGMGEVLGVTPDHTSFNHVRVCNHFVHFFPPVVLVLAVVGVESVLRECLTGGKMV